MATVLITNLAPIDDAACAMFDELIAACKERGHTAVLWSCIHRAEHSDHYLPMRWDLGTWGDFYDGALLETYMGGEPLVDEAKWLPRIERLCKQSVNRGERRPVFETVHAVTRAVVDMVQPELVLSWNKLCPHAGILSDVCEASGIPSYLLERGPMPDTWYFERGGLVGHSVLADKPFGELIPDDQRDFSEALGQAMLDTLRGEDFNSYAQKSGTEAFQALNKRQTNGPRIVFFPPDDTSLGFTPEQGEDRKKHLPGFVSSYDSAVALAAANAGGITVYKPHPSFMEEMPPAEHESGLLSVEEDFRALIQWADIVATSGSGLQFLALAQGKPVISTGADILTGKGITYEARTADAAQAAIESAVAHDDSGERQSRFQAMLGYLMGEYLMSLRAKGGLRPGVAFGRVLDELSQAGKLSGNNIDVSEVREQLLAPGAMITTSN